MSEMTMPDTAARVCRVDKFVVPQPAREEFITRVLETHALLRKLPGFVQDYVLEQSSGSGRFNFVTLVAWQSAASIEPAQAAVAAMHAAAGFSPQALFARLGIEADLGNYQHVAEAPEAMPRA